MNLVHILWSTHVHHHDACFCWPVIRKTANIIAVTIVHDANPSLWPNYLTSFELFTESLCCSCPGFLRIMVKAWWGWVDQRCYVNCMPPLSLLRVCFPAYPRLFEITIYLFFDQNVIFYVTRSWKPSANNQICWIIKVSTNSKTLSHFCRTFIHLKAVFIGDLYKFRFVTKWGRYSPFQLLIMLEYRLCWLIYAKSDK